MSTIRYHRKNRKDSRKVTIRNCITFLPLLVEQGRRLRKLSRLALKISEKGHDSYSDAISFIRTKISFALLRSSVLCLRGCRALKRQVNYVESSIAAAVQAVVNYDNPKWVHILNVSFFTIWKNFGVLQSNF